VGACSADIKLKAPVQVQGDGREALLTDTMAKAGDYFKLGSGNIAISDDAFQAVYGKPLPKQNREPGDPFTISSTLGDIWTNPIGKPLVLKMMEGMGRMFGGGAPAGGEPPAPPTELPAGLAEMPLRSIALFAGDQLSLDMLDTLVAAMNGNITPEFQQMMAAFGGKK
jgi:hypothetical protein